MGIEELKAEIERLLERNDILNGAVKMMSEYAEVGDLESVLLIKKTVYEQTAPQLSQMDAEPEIERLKNELKR